MCNAKYIAYVGVIFMGHFDFDAADGDTSNHYGSLDSAVMGSGY